MAEDMEAHFEFNGAEEEAKELFESCDIEYRGNLQVG
jgi:hypothetical protein